MTIISENGREFMEVSLPIDVVEKLEAIASLEDMNPWREDMVIELLIKKYKQVT